jgi:lipoprotein-releasing system permease protein
MFKPLELFVGLRYTRSKRDNNFISFISLASMLGITLGVLVLITVISVMNGFEKELRDRILGMVSHVTVSGTNGLLQDWQPEQEKLNNNKSIVGTAPYIQKQVMLTSDNEVRGVLLQGILPEHEDAVNEVNAHMLDGSLSDLEDRKYRIALGVELATALNVGPGDKVTVISPQAQVTPAGVIPRMKRFTVAAVYQMGLQDYDSASAFIHMADAARLFRTRKAVTGVRLKLNDLFEAPALAQTLSKELGSDYKVASWVEENGSLFHAVKMEKIMMSLVLALIVGVALFNLVSSLVMMVNDKQADIAILRTQGMSPKTISRIFMIQGSIVGIIGTLLGVILGVLLAVNVENIVPAIENMLGRQLFASDVFYISEVPSDLHVSDVWIIGIASLVASVLATIYPAHRAAKIQPAESLRYE